MAWFLLITMKLLDNYFKWKFHYQLENMLVVCGRIEFNADSETNKYSGYVYDAVWLYAYALGNYLYFRNVATL